MKPDVQSFVLNKQQSQSGDKTFVIFGAPRGGTTMVAGITRVLGLNIGADLPDNCEDPDFNMDLMRRQEMEAAPALSSAVDQRNQTLGTWGWKYPKASAYLAELLPKLRNPHFICIFRDSLSSSRRHILNVERSPIEALRRAQRIAMRNIDFLESCNAPSLLLSYERALMKPMEFTEELASFIGVHTPEAITAGADFIGNQGGYQAAPEPWNGEFIK